MKLSRRDILKRAGLYSLLWPVLNMIDARAGGAQPPKRVLVLFNGNGPIIQQGPASGTETNFQLHDWWQPLEAHKADGVFFRGVHQAGVPFGTHNEYGHQSAATGSLTARTTEGTNNATGPSIDQFIGQELQNAGIVTPKRSLLWGLHNDTSNWGPWYEAAGEPIAPVNNPYAALDDLSPYLSSDGKPNPALLRKRLVLDQAYKDCKAMTGDLGAEGKALLDFHCSNIDSLEKSVSSSIVTGPQCIPPTGPNTTLGPDENFSQPSTRDELVTAFSDLMALAFACDLTRVIGFSFSSPAARFGIPDSYPIPIAPQADSGDSGPQHHAWTHFYGASDDKTAALRGFTRWYAQSVSTILDKLKNTLDASGKPLLDSTLVLYTCELGYDAVSQNDAHSNFNIPVMLFGGDDTIKKNRLFVGDGTTDSALDLHRLLVSMIRHTGLTDIDSFGNAGSGPLDWLQG
jgi:hypothetical protein